MKNAEILGQDDM